MTDRYPTHTAIHPPPPRSHRSVLATLTIVLLGFCTPAIGEQTPTRIHLDRLALIGGTAATFRYVGFRYVDRAWYQGQKTDNIRWLNDWGGQTYVNFDKAGHFMGGLVMSQTLNEAYAWAGFGTRSAAFVGTLTSWAALLEIEMRDAYFDQWGFSIPDFVANTAGASLPLLHALFPRTRAIGFKFSYFPSNLYVDHKDRALANRPHIEHVIDDYEGMTTWMTVAVEQLLPDRAAAHWPDDLGLALGYGVKGLHGSNVKSRGRFKRYPDRPDAQPEVLLGLDYDARRLPGRSRLAKYFKQQLNWLHLPTPAVRIYPNFRFYLLYM